MKTQIFFYEYGLRPRVSSVFSGRIRKFLKTLPRVEIFLSDTNTYTCWRSYPEIFEYAFVILLDSVFTASIINKHGVQQGCSFFVSCSDLTFLVWYHAFRWMQLWYLYTTNTLEIDRMFWDCYQWTVGIIKSKKERTITEGDSGRDQEGQAHGGTILSMAQWSKKNGERILKCLNLAILVNTRFPVDALSDLLRFVFFRDRQQ